MDRRLPASMILHIDRAAREVLSYAMFSCAKKGLMTRRVGDREEGT